MPLLKLETNVSLPDDNRDMLLSNLSKIVADTIGKPEQYVMVTFNSSAILMSGKQGPAAFVDVRSIGGLSGLVNEKLSQQICSALKEALVITPDRVYINFANVEASNWGWNNETFG
jgi:phenylpyruvate tautomerase